MSQRNEPGRDATAVVDEADGTLPSPEGEDRSPGGTSTASPQALSSGTTRAQLAPGKPVRVALIGAGYIADFHVQILRNIPAVEIVAVCDPAPGRAAQFARRWEIPSAVASVEELQGLDIHVAHLLIPPDLHVPVARQLLDWGIGAFVEKPLALASADARDLFEHAAERELPFGVNHNNLFHPAFTRLMERVRAGEIGRVEHVQVTFHVPLAQLDVADYGHWMFRSTRNIVYEQALHPLCQVHALLGPVSSCNTTILSSRELHPGQTFHDRWMIAAAAERGTAEVYLGFGGTFVRNTLQVLGTDGSLEADMHHDLTAGERKTIWLDFWNSFLAGWRRGAELRRDARHSLSRYLRATLGLAGRGDAFFIGMQRSVESFYRQLRSPESLRREGVDATEVLEWCEAVAEGVPDEASPQATWPEAGAPRTGEVVVLGGTGFIGRRVVARLVAEEQPVTLVARRAHGLAPELRAAIDSGRVRLVRGSLEEPASIAAALDGAHAVIQLATGSGNTWEELERSMVGGSVAVAEASLARGVKRFVYVSSIAALYTGDDAKPELEDSLGVDPQPRPAPAAPGLRAAAYDRPSRGRGRRRHPDAALRLRRLAARQPLHRLGPRRAPVAARLGRRRGRRAGEARRRSARRVERPGREPLRPDRALGTRHGGRVSSGDRPRHPLPPALLRPQPGTRGRQVGGQGGRAKTRGRIPLVARSEGTRPAPGVHLAHRARAAGLEADGGPGGVSRSHRPDLRSGTRRPADRGQRLGLSRDRPTRPPPESPAMSGPAPHLLHVFSTFVPAGPEVRTTRIIAGLGQEFRHSILAMDGRTSAAKELPADAPARIMDNLPPAGTLQTTLNLRRLLQRERPDLVLTYNWGAFDAILAARSLGWKRLIHHEEGFNLDEAVTFKRRRVLARRWAITRRGSTWTRP